MKRREDQNVIIASCHRSRRTHVLSLMESATTAISATDTSRPAVVEDADCFTETCGQMPTVQYQKDGMSTTSTMIGATTILATLKRYHHRSTSTDTHTRGSRWKVPQSSASGCESGGQGESHERYSAPIAGVMLLPVGCRRDIAAHIAESGTAFSYCEVA